MLEIKFKIDVEKDVNGVHPPRFCLPCYLSQSREPTEWEPHSDNGNCKTCQLILKLQKGGRPSKKKKRSLSKSDSTAKSTSNEGQSLVAKIEEIATQQRSLRNDNFNNLFEASELVLKDAFCAICQDLLNKPISIKCEHIFCAECLTQLLKTTPNSGCLQSGCQDS